MDYALTGDDVANVKRVLLASPAIDSTAFINCQLHRIQFPIGHTAGSYAIAYRHEVDPLAKLIRAAPWQSGSAHMSHEVLAIGETSTNMPTQQPADNACRQSVQASPVPSIVDASTSNPRIPKPRSPSKRVVGGFVAWIAIRPVA